MEVKVSSVSENVSFSLGGWGWLASLLPLFLKLRSQYVLNCRDWVPKFETRQYKPYEAP